MNDKSFYLTFDGAPNPPGTDAVLRVLSKHDVKATFFMEGRRLEGESACAERVLEKGHEIGNHSYHHPKFDEISLDDCREEVQRTEDIIRAKLGLRLHLFRPPWGNLTPEATETVQGMGYSIVLWSYSIRDWEGPDAEAVAKRVLDQLEDEAVVVFHDRIPWNPAVLDRIIPEIKASRYAFKKVSEAGPNRVILRKP